MKAYQEIIQWVNSFHEQGETIHVAEFLITEYNLNHPNFKGFELREKAKPDFILMTTEGILGGPQIIRIPENTFEFPLNLMLNLLAHEMIHVQQKAIETLVEDKNEREWQAYYENLFHKQFPQIPELSDFHKKAFASKALDYYNRMEVGSELQKKYVEQKVKVEMLLSTLI
ncbi:hypothetical protein EQG68_03665 [Flavobacterium piscinae]|uniref:SprT-like domain-containing protein n=1 Tax=Flavobacterium piscinae TaxID=2506424 RepID=A0A4Q1KXW7_9FLAO|nr:hypothetical protein [Flavobacterium piscinae]RXR34144.1 hypothetical protein EQG68_03665 [Flavobacterium piscinae]